ncbi:MAG TPA: DUF2142 domain-containing protein [Thermoleophilaceae bacterium]|nr:DUF2142 domain-containing protein [Thermoleophilaceae bacterium]
MLHRLRQVPLPLACLLGAATFLACAWIVLMPPLQGPDEVSHFAYVQRIAERHVIPWTPSGNGGGQPYSTEVGTALVQGGVGPLSRNIAARPLWTRADERLWSRTAAGADRGDGGYTSAMRNPPLYYLYELVPYGISSGGKFWDQALLMRFANVPLFLIALAFIWLLAGELLGRGPLQYIAAATAALIPQLTNIVATVNPDIALVAEWSAALYLMTLVMRRGPRRGLIVALALLLVAGGFTQPRSLPLVVPAAMAALLGLARERGWRRVNPLTLGLGALLIGVPLVVALAARGLGSVRQFGSYIWQFYLPKLGSMAPTIGPVHYDVRLGFVDRIFGTLAQLEVGLPPTIEDVAWWVVRLGLVALLAALVIKRDAVRRNAGLAVVFLTAIWTLLASLHLVAYRAMLSSPGDPIITGRYLLPLIGLLGLAVAIVGSVLPRMARAAYAGVVLAAGVAIQVVSLGLLLERFYA